MRESAFSPEYAIIGGGWAGIAAAVTLTRIRGSGSGIQLFEAGRRLGGRARSTQSSGEILDEGQHILLGAYHETLSLMREVGVDPETALRRLPLTIQDNRGFRLALPRLPPPLHLATGLLTAGGVAWDDKFRLLKFASALRREPNAMLSVTQWLQEHGQSRFLRERLWEPLCLAALNTPPERASARIFRNVLNDSLGSFRSGATDLLLPRVSLSSLLPDPAAAWLDEKGVRLHFGTRVRGLEALPDGWRLRHGKGDTCCRNLILAVAPQHLPALLEGLGVSLPTYDYEPIGTVYLRYPPQTTLPFPLMALTGGVGQWVVDRGGGLLAASLSGHGAWTALSRTELATALCNAIRPCLVSRVGADCQPLFSRMFVARRATFSCVPGLVRIQTKTPWPNLRIAGDHSWQDYPATLEGAVRSGTRAARQILEAP